MADEEFTFDIQDYLKVNSKEQYELTGKINSRIQEIDSKCKSDTEKTEKQQRELKAELLESDPTLLSLRKDLDAIDGNQYSASVRRGGIICCSNHYGLIYIAKKCDLYIIPFASIEARDDILPVKSFPTDIKQIGLSSSELYLSVTLDESINIFESRMLKLNVSSTVFINLFLIYRAYIVWCFVSRRVVFLN